MTNQEQYELICEKAKKYDRLVGVFDKIRAEIDSYCSDNRDRNDGLYIAMRIIDKHLQEIESEEKN